MRSIVVGWLEPKLCTTASSKEKTQFFRSFLSCLIFGAGAPHPSLLNPTLSVICPCVFRSVSLCVWQTFSSPLFVNVHRKSEHLDDHNGKTRFTGVYINLLYLLYYYLCNCALVVATFDRFLRIRHKIQLQ